MPLNETDKAWIRQEIHSTQSRRGFGKLTGFIKDWSGAGAAVAILILVVTQWGNYVEFRTNTKDRLDTIDSTLKDVRSDVSALKIRADASLPTTDFQAALPGLKSALTVAKEAKKSVIPTVMTQLQRQLLDVRDRTAPDFWPTVSEFISYRSAIFASNVRSNLPDCTDSDPKPGRVISIERRPGTERINFSTSEYDDCRLTLDSPKDSQRINYLIQQKDPFLTFKRCLVVYRGGPINLIVAVNGKPTMIVTPGTGPLYATATGKTLHFENCVFDFVLNSEPPLRGQEITQTLLAQNGLSADIGLQVK